MRASVFTLCPDSYWSTFSFNRRISTRFTLSAREPTTNLSLFFVLFCFLLRKYSHHNLLVVPLSLLLRERRKMKAPNMEMITKSLEKSMQNFSLSDRRRRVGDRFGRSSTTTEESSNEHVPPISDRTLELNSHISLPCHWEQCLDLKVNPKKRKIKCDYSSSFFFVFLSFLG